MKIAIIGDVHGCHRTLVDLLGKIPKDVEQIYSVGDLIDRGPHSKDVVQEFMDRGIKAVIGNHEDMFLDYKLDGGKIYGSCDFMANGGDMTLVSYGNRIPDDHMEFISNLPLYIEADDFLLTHAGVALEFGNSGVDWKSVKPSAKNSVLWQRGQIADIGKLQIFGHTPDEKPLKIRRGGRVVATNIDSACVHGHYLTALILPECKVIKVQKSNKD